MAKNKFRGGAANHKKRVENRNNLMKNMWQRQVNMAYEKHEEWKQQQSGSTEDNFITIQNNG